MVQLTHDVSAAAANSFWKIASTSIPELFHAREELQIKKNVPGYIHLRRKLYEESPTVHMKFVYMNRETKAIEIVQCTKAPVKNFPKSKFVKLYEEAHVKVT